MQDDLISREAVIEWLENATYEDISYAVGTELSFLPSITRQTRENCEYRHENGNCLKVGGFCTAVNDKHCEKCAMNGSDSKYCDNCKYKRQIGEWIKSKDSYGNYHYTCPYCEHDIATKSENWDDNYCANCGADLRSTK